MWQAAVQNLSLLESTTNTFQQIGRVSTQSTTNELNGTTFLGRPDKWTWQIPNGNG